MKKFVLYACLFSIISACEKAEERDNIMPANEQSNSIAITAFGERFGVFPTLSYDNPPGVKTHNLSTGSLIPYIQNTLKVRYVRMRIDHNLWVADSNSYRDTIYLKFNAFRTAHIKVQINANWVDTSTALKLFPNGLSYKAWLKEVLDSLENHGGDPNLVVIQNEETNKEYADQTEANNNLYIEDLTQGSTVCYNRSIPVTNGGFTHRNLAYLTWDWIKKRKGLDSAKAFGNLVFPPHIEKKLETGGIDSVATNLSLWKEKISEYKNKHITYINMHWYEPAYIRDWSKSDSALPPEHLSGGMPKVMEYLHAKIPTVQYIISNEIGQDTLSGCTTNDFLNYLSSTTMPVMIWFDGDGDLNKKEARALRYTTSNGILNGLTPAGTAFTAWMRGSGMPCH